MHQLRVCPCPQLPIGYYWYGGNRHSSGKVPSWVDKLLSASSSNDPEEWKDDNEEEIEGDVMEELQHPEFKD